MLSILPNTGILALAQGWEPRRTMFLFYINFYCLVQFCFQLARPGEDLGTLATVSHNATQNRPGIPAQIWQTDGLFCFLWEKEVGPPSGVHGEGGPVQICSGYIYGSILFQYRDPHPGGHIFQFPPGKKQFPRSAIFGQGFWYFDQFEP